MLFFSDESALQEELEVLDRVRFVGPYSTSPCMQKIAAPAADGGCGRPFVGEYALDPDAKQTEPTEFDAHFGFGSDVATKKIYMQCVP